MLSLIETPRSLCYSTPYIRNAIKIKVNSYTGVGNSIHKLIGEIYIGREKGVRSLFSFSKLPYT